VAWVFIFELAVNFGSDDEAARRAKAVFADAELRAGLHRVQIPAEFRTSSFPRLT
jgi:hypothetical protein